MIILKWFAIIFGIAEIVSNSFHLLKGKLTLIGESGRLQHQELPKDISNIHYFIKVLIMAIFGLLFTLAAIIAFIDAKNLALLQCTAISFGVYGLIQAFVYFKEIKVWLAVIVYNIPLILLYFGL